MPRRKVKVKNEPRTTLAVGLSALLALPVFTHTLTLVQWYGVWGAVGAPRAYAVLVSLSLGMYAWLHAREQWARYVLVVVATVDILCMLIWLFGITSLGHALAGPRNIL